MYGLSDSGWMNSELFELWFLHHFLPHAPAARPLLLLLDGHSSHYNPAVIRKAAQEKVILFCLPTHSSHETQPLDKGPFAPLKIHWREVCHKFMSENPGKVVTRFTFSKLFNEAWTKAMTIGNVSAGFQSTGIYPLNREALLPQKKKDNTLAESTGLKFIPMCSPMRQRHTPISFSQEEEKFQKRYEEKYNIKDDIRYNKWKKLRYPESDCSDNDEDETTHTEPSSTSITATCESMPVIILQCHQPLPLTVGPPMVSISSHNSIEPSAIPQPLTAAPMVASILSQAPSMQQAPSLPRLYLKLLQNNSKIKLPSFPSKSSAKVLTTSENLKAIAAKEKKKADALKEKEEKQQKGIYLNLNELLLC